MQGILYKENFRVGNSIIGFSIESIVFCDRKIDWIVRKIESLEYKYSILVHYLRGDRTEVYLDSTVSHSGRRLWGKILIIKK